MTTLLHIDCSAQQDQSVSRRLSGEFVSLWKDANPAAKVTYRDLTRSPLPHLTRALEVQALDEPPESRTPLMWQVLAQSDRLTDELLAADRLVMGVPMYNFSIPSALKAYIDLIVREGRTFEFGSEEGQPPRGLIQDKKMLVITARGANYEGPPWQDYDFLEPYLRALFGFLGFGPIQFINANDTRNKDKSIRKAGEEKAYEAIMELVGSF